MRSHTNKCPTTPHHKHCHTLTPSTEDYWKRKVTRETTIKNDAGPCHISQCSNLACGLTVTAISFASLRTDDILPLHCATFIWYFCGLHGFSFHLIVIIFHMRAVKIAQSTLFYQVYSALCSLHSVYCYLLAFPLSDTWACNKQLLHKWATGESQLLGYQKSQ